MTTNRLGHASAAATMTTYGHLLPTAAAARLQLLEDVVTTAIAYGLEGSPAAGVYHLARVFPDLAAAAEEQRPEVAGWLGASGPDPVSRQPEEEGVCSYCADGTDEEDTDR